MMQEIGRFLIILSVVIGLFGLLLFFSGKIPFFGRLPGDIVVERKNFTLYIPIVSSIILSIIISLILNLIKK
jgi:hypothetical protein